MEREFKPAPMDADGVLVAPAVGPSGSDWECVGAFYFNDYGGWQQLAKEYEDNPDATKLYRKRTAGVREVPND